MNVCDDVINLRLVGATLYEKVFNRHAVKQLSSGQYQLFMGLHLVHEVTSPQAFEMLRERGLEVLYPQRTFATVDHIVPTDTIVRPYRDNVADEMLSVLEKNVNRSRIAYFGTESHEQGIVHVIGPELGLTQPGMTICCGDSHTSTHGAFGSLAFGIGTSQVRDVLATQTLAMSKLKVKRVAVEGKLSPLVTAKDVALYIIQKLGVKGGVGYAYEYGGSTFDAMSMDERMTVCNMSIEGGARCGYVNPDETTYAYLKGRKYAPREEHWSEALNYWQSIRSDINASYDDQALFNAADIEPMVTWGITPGQSVGVSSTVPSLETFSADERDVVSEAYRYMDFKPGQPIAGTPIQVAFVGSCTNGRLSDFETIAQAIDGKGLKVAKGVRALIVPGSMPIRQEMIRRGYDKLFMSAGFDFRHAGCSMCLAMNPDRLQDREICASSSNRNFKGRQGSPTGRTLLMSPLMVAAAALAGEVVDARKFFEVNP